MLISGQLGIELWAAEVVFDLQVEYDELKLGILTPFLEQEEKWNEDNKEYYEYIVSSADFVDSITKRKYDNPNQFRLKNEFLFQKVKDSCWFMTKKTLGLQNICSRRPEKGRVPRILHHDDFFCRSAAHCGRRAKQGSFLDRRITEEN